MQTNEIAVIGAGIVGLATTLALVQRRPGARIVVLDKEAQVAAHQSGHNSGVIHSGIYYKPGSLKARLCVSGARKMKQFCEENGIHYEMCGKLIVATEPEELPRLEALFERAQANGVPGVTRLGPEQMREIEPHAAGLAGLHSPQTGIVDYREVAKAMQAAAERAGVQFQMGSRVKKIVRTDGALRIESSRGEVAAKYMVNCAGLYSDRIAQLMGQASDVRIVPFRGEYYM